MANDAIVSGSFEPDRVWFRSTDGRVLLAGSPLTQYTVTSGGSRVLDALESADPLPAGHEGLTGRLSANGAIHRRDVAPGSPDDITVVIPTHVTTPEDLERLRHLVARLRGMAIIVVDDCSPIVVSVEQATVVRHDHNTGPGAARNTGLALTDTRFVAFVDDDTTVNFDHVCALAGHLVDGDVDIVAPRVASTAGDGALADYEQTHSPLDLGDSPGVVRPGARISYVPSAVLVCSVDSLEHLSGFDESLRIGEDVDLVWRASRDGLTCRFVPSVRCGHRPRATLGGFISQRRRYGSSSARLAARHGGAVAPIRTHPLLVAPSLLALTGFPLAFIASAVAMYAWFIFTLRATRLGIGDRARVVTIGAWSSARLLVTATARTWWPLFALASLWSPRVLLMFAVSLMAPPLVELVTKRPRHPSRYVVLHLLDDLSYGLGVWQGALALRNGKCLLPAVVLPSRRLRSKA